MTIKEADNLGQLIKLLKKVKDNKFNYGSICTKDNEDSPFQCNTTACAYGYFPTVFPNKYKWTEDNFYGGGNKHYTVVLRSSDLNNNTLIDAETESMRVAAEDLGMTREEFDRIFMGVYTHETYGVALTKDVTRKMVIKKLTNFLNEKGYVLT